MGTNKAIKGSVLVCVQCDQEFVFSEHEQDRFAKMGFDKPQRCPGCRKNKKKIYSNEVVQKGKRRRHNEKDDY